MIHEHRLKTPIVHVIGVEGAIVFSIEQYRYLLL